MRRLSTKPGPAPATTPRGALTTYRTKRDFAETPEPRGIHHGAPAGRQSIFVVQKHAASHLHYDFRLELGGTLKSWAIPKGVPLASGERRLAVHVEDHPLDYANFEGTIPKGHYGGGTVMLWDRGTYEVLSPQPRKALKDGKLHFILHGEKLQGEWALVRLRDGKNWLLLRIGEPARPISKAMDDKSVVSGRSMKEIAMQRAPYAIQDRATKKIPRKQVGASSAHRQVPEFIEPMLAKLVEIPPADGKWRYEVKFDGFRVLARKDASEVTLTSRNGLPLTQRFASLAAAISELAVKEAVIDGEVVAIDAHGRSSFQELHTQNEADLIYYAFDLPWIRGRDLRGEPLETRRQELRKLLRASPSTVRFSAELKGGHALLMEKAAAMGLEGLIAKRAESLYESGQRTGAWIKLKCAQQQEFVIGGYTAPRGSRQHLGALLVGYYANGRLRFAGKVGTGFSDQVRADLHQLLIPLEVATPPFVEPERSLRAVHWVRPTRVCQLKFTEWTRDGRLRHPVFLGMREDKTASAVRREIPTAPP
jgi:bifunctional non-homologous end joining protein LigD